MAGLNPSLRDWNGRAVWLIGASSGIGLACAKALHRAGARVSITGRRTEPLSAFVAEHPGSLGVAADVTERASVLAAATYVRKRHGLETIIYCAGHYHPMRAQSFDLVDCEQHLDINYRGALYVLDAVLPYLKPGAHISLVSSVAGHRGLPRSLAYGPTKAALSHLGDVLYLDLRPQGIGVSVVHPGFVATPLTAQNDFEMPALMTPEAAAAAMLEGWAQGEFDIHFPKRFTRPLRFLRHLPDRLYFALVRRFTGL